MKLSSPAFEHGAAIPVLYTCIGANVNPPLRISDVPPGTRSFVLVLEDVDAHPVWTHWLLFNIPISMTEIPENAIPEGAVEALANNHSFGYEGPCPKYFKGVHHYWFRLYALDRKLDLPAATERAEIWKGMLGHITGEAFLLGVCDAAAHGF